MTTDFITSKKTTRPESRRRAMRLWNYAPHRSSPDHVHTMYRSCYRSSIILTAHDLDLSRYIGYLFPILHDLLIAHVCQAGDPYHPRDLAHVSWVICSMHRSCTASRDGSPEINCSRRSICR